MTKHEAILQAIKAKLTGFNPTTGLADESVYRSLTIALSRGKSPALSIEPVQELSDYTPIGRTDWTADFRVTILIRADIPDQEADPIKQEVHEKISTDLSLGGLSMDIRLISVNYDIIEGDKNVGIITMTYRVFYRTDALSLT